MKNEYERILNKAAMTLLRFILDNCLEGVTKAP